MNLQNGLQYELIDLRQPQGLGVMLRGQGWAGQHPRFLLQDLIE